MADQFLMAELIRRATRFLHVTTRRVDIDELRFRPQEKTQNIDIELSQALECDLAPKLQKMRLRNPEKFESEFPSLLWREKRMLEEKLFMEKEEKAAKDKQKSRIEMRKRKKKRSHVVHEKMMAILADRERELNEIDKSNQDFRKTIELRVARLKEFEQKRYEDVILMQAKTKAREQRVAARVAQEDSSTRKERAIKSREMFETANKALNAQVNKIMVSSGTLEPVDGCISKEVNLGQRGGLKVSKYLEASTCNEIIELNLSWCELGFTGFSKIVPKLANLENLKQLRLRGNSLGDEAIGIFAKMLQTTKPQTLSSIDLSANNIGNKGAQALAHLIAKGEPCFQTLNLSHNLLRHKGLIAIIQSSFACPKLQLVDLRANRPDPKKMARYRACIPPAVQI